MKLPEAPGKRCFCGSAICKRTQTYPVLFAPQRPDLMHHRGWDAGYVEGKADGYIEGWRAAERTRRYV